MDLSFLKAKGEGNRLGVSGGRDTGPSGPRRFKFDVSLGGLIAISVALLLGAVWIFVLGVLLGRGYRPENAVPEIAQMMPQPAPAAEEKPKILKPEELTYMDELTKKPAGQVPVEPMVKPVVPHKPEEPKHEPAKAEAAKTAKPEPAKSTPAKAEPPKVAAKPEPAKPEPAKPDATRQEAAKLGQQIAKGEAAKTIEPKPDSFSEKFIYIYQAGAFQKDSVAKDLKAKIEAEGLASGVESVQVGGETWHRVLIYVKGSPENIKKMNERMAKLGVKQVVYRSKKPL